MTTVGEVDIHSALPAPLSLPTTDNLDFDTMDDLDSQGIAQATPAPNVFIPPSIHERDILRGRSYTHHSAIPDLIAKNLSTECVLGIDEAGRGPVIGPMVYGLLYLPLSSHRSLLAETHHFDDSKVLTPAVRSNLMQALCTADTNLYHQCGWATRVMSAQDISAGMLKLGATYNLNAQAMDATIDLIKEVFSKGVNVTEIYIDTIGKPEIYQKKLERIFPTILITVAKKADSLYPCVSAASVCAKVTRDAALETCYQIYATEAANAQTEGWGSGYPSDARSINWLKANMDPVFGWGNECRFSWSTLKDLLEANKEGGMSSVKVNWPSADDENHQKPQITDFLDTSRNGEEEDAGSELVNWFGKPVAEGVF